GGPDAQARVERGVRERREVAPRGGAGGEQEEAALPLGLGPGVVAAVTRHGRTPGGPAAIGDLQPEQGGAEQVEAPDDLAAGLAGGGVVDGGGEQLGAAQLDGVDGAVGEAGEVALDVAT